MSPRDHIDESGRALWRRVAPPPPGPCPDLIDLAAFADGRLDPAAREAVEAHLASCGACLEAVRDVPAALDEARLVLVPSHVIESARALVPAAAPAAPLRSAPPWRLGPVLRWGLAAAAAVAISAAGYQAGLRSLAAEPEADLVAEATFGLLGSSESDVDVLFAALIDEEVAP